MTDGTDFEAPPTDLITLTRHILNRQHEIGEKASGDLTLLLVGIQVSRPTKLLSSWDNRRGIARSNSAVTLRVVSQRETMDGFAALLSTGSCAFPQPAQWCAVTSSP